LDINGNPIFPRGKYYILPTIRGLVDGVLRLGKSSDLECEAIVKQDYIEVINVLLVKFNIPGISPGIIFIGTQIETEFTKKA
jgi:hypothetical protein